MAITPIEFGKNLRPSTVDAMNKINEIIAQVNELDPGNISQLTSDVSTLKTQMSTANSNISTLQTNYSSMNGTLTETQQDVDDIKVTLYTPLSTSENS